MHRKRRIKYSEGFLDIFTFFLQSYRHEILDFCGVDVKTEMDINSGDSKLCFRDFENGKYPKHTTIPTRHPNVLKGVIIGKKSWGLHVKMWSEGISEGLFTQKEILEQFDEKGIKVPESLLIDFENQIIKRLM